MGQINSNQIIQKPEVVIDPNFYVPGDVANVRPASTEDLIPSDPDQDYLSGADYDSAIIDAIGTDTTTPPPDPVGGTDTLGAPQTISIVSQTVRTTSDGTTVVDVVIATEDIAGATNYEVRITPA